METTDHKTTDGSGIIAALATLPPEAIIDEAGLAQIFNRHPVSIKRAIKRGELPPGVRLFGKPTWTAKSILDHVGRRLEDAKKDRERLERRISQLAP
jgi:hypothetical protein